LRYVYTHMKKNTKIRQNPTTKFDYKIRLQNSNVVRNSNSCVTYVKHENLSTKHLHTIRAHNTRARNTRVQNKTREHKTKHASTKHASTKHENKINTSTKYEYKQIRVLNLIVVQTRLQNITTNPTTKPYEITLLLILSLALQVVIQAELVT
jgi:hypothetical protein